MKVDAQAPEIQTMYNVPFPVSVIRTKMRQEFERHRYVNKLPVIDVLLFQSHAEYQVQGHISTTYKAREPRLTGAIGNNELLEAGEPRHVIFPGGQLQGRQEVAVELHVGFLGGKVQIFCLLE